jgi:trehalose 6-phosphate phosphatase
MTVPPKALGATSEAVVDACLAVLRHSPAALTTDIDGTISKIAPTPGEAVVDPTAKAALALLSGRLAEVVVVSGRAPEVAGEMVGHPGLTYIGNHGLERIARGEHWTHPAAEAARPAVTEALAEIERKAKSEAETPWLVIENKGVTGTVHYRLAPDAQTAEAFLQPLAVAATARHGLRLTKGRMIFELRPQLAINKGTAILDLVHDLGLRGIVFFGDDLTDLDAFRALRELREAGEAATLRVAVLGPDTARVILDEADLTVDSVEECASVLLGIAARLTNPAPESEVETADSIETNVEGEP